MNIETDYLVIGSGAVGMAFVDVLLSETDADIVIVDKYAKPGGHWNLAYPFVTLHQPSQFYGVSSKELSRGELDKVGLNKGLFDLATGAEVSAYYDEVMRDTFLASGRVRYFPLCEYQGDHKFSSIITGDNYEVTVNRKLINAAFHTANVPSAHTPNFTIDDGVNFMPLNDLPKITTPPEGFVVIGGGKTGIDACLWLIQNRVPYDKITWIVSRDGWLLDRGTTQPTNAFFEKTIGNQANQFEAVAQSSSIADMYQRLEDKGVLVRIDKTVKPRMFHGATISQMELSEMRKIKKVVRKGKVKHIAQNQIVLEHGTIATSRQVVHVDCSASAITNLEIKPIFSGQVVTPQMVRSYQPIFSAALIAYVEAHYDHDKEKNELCQVVPLPDHDTDWMVLLAAQMRNQFTWSQDKTLNRWIRSNRLDGFAKMIKNVDKDNAKHVEILKRLRNNALPAVMKLQQYISEIEPNNSRDMSKPQFQVNKSMFFNGRLSEMPDEATSIADGEVLVKIDKFAYTSNNITYAVAADMVGYWKFFPALGEDADGYGVIPVWGFADVVESKAEGVPVGDRLFGYFPPASHLKMIPTRIKEGRFIDGMEHRAQLPIVYNSYIRVHNEPGYNSDTDNARMLFFPLHMTSFCIWDSLQIKDWYGAEQIIILSASSKTSTGLGYALQADNNAPHVIGVTSQRNLSAVEGFKIYDHCLSYDTIDQVDTTKPTVIIDMSGNADVLVKLHTKLGDQMKWCVNVGLTHWDKASPQAKEGIITERSGFFFAPGHIERRTKEWGSVGFAEKTAAFMKETAAKTNSWMTYRSIDGLTELAKIHQTVCQGKIPANEGLIVEL